MRNRPFRSNRPPLREPKSCCAWPLAPVISAACARRRRSLRAVQSRRSRGSAADSHPADPPAMAVPETLVHPFATAKIVVWPATCSVRGGLIIAARSRDATLRACRRHGERTSDRCDRDEGNKCLLHSKGPPADDALGWRQWTVKPQRAIVSGQLSALIGASFELLVAKPQCPLWGQTRKSGGVTGRSALPAQADIVRSVGQSGS